MVVELLVANKVTCDIPDKEGRTPLELAVINGYESVAELLLRKRAKLQHQKVVSRIALWRKAFMHAATNGHETVVKFLIKHSAIANYRDCVN